MINVFQTIIGSIISFFHTKKQANATIKQPPYDPIKRKIQSMFEDLDGINKKTYISYQERDVVMPPSAIKIARRKQEKSNGPKRKKV